MNISKSFLVVFAFLIVTCFCRWNYTAQMIAHNSSYYKFSLTYIGQKNYYLKPTSPILKNLICEFKCLTFNDFQFKIYDQDSPRFQIPSGGLFPQDPYRKYSYPIQFSAFKLAYNLEPFEFEIRRRNNTAILFSTLENDFIFSQYYMQMSTILDTEYTYGLGERFSKSFRLKEGKWTIFNRDRGNVIDQGHGFQTYGHNPVYLQRQRKNKFHINYFKNSNAMDIVISKKGSNRVMTFKTIGGILDFRLVLGEGPEQTVQKFHQVIGKSIVPPFWALGFHQSRYGYDNITKLEQVIQNYKKNSLPLDTIWTDIDYMADYEDFTIDQKRFPLSRMKAITDVYHYIPIIDAGIKTGTGQAYKEGVKRNVFIKDASGKQLKGKVWPGQTAFTDFFHPEASRYWQDMLQILYDKVNFSGIWLDMNQYANFCNGPCTTPTGAKGFDYSKDLPYNPGNDNIEAHTISLNATHYNHTREADVHAFAGMLESAATYKFLSSKGLVPFIISRSTAIGSNQYAFHWTGDNHANFQFLKGSISDNFNNQIWGMHMVGADICGFGGNTTEQLCARWFQLGALYPFARNHNDKSSIDQQPYALGATVLKAAKTALNLRYSLLKYYYYSFIKNRGTGTVFRPMFFDSHEDNHVYNDDIIDTQFLIGNNIFAAPILEPQRTQREVYFPSDSSWYDIYTGTRYKNASTHTISNVSVTNPIPLFIKQGGVIMMNNATHVNSTKDLGSNFHLIGGFRYEPKRSNETYKHYEAKGGVLSIQEYNDKVALSDCLNTGCQYVMNCVLQISNIGKQVEVDVTYLGVPSHNQLIKIQEVTVFYEGHKLHNKLLKPVQISKTSKVAIPLKDAVQIINQDANLTIEE